MTNTLALQRVAKAAEEMALTIRAHYHRYPLSAEDPVIEEELAALEAALAQAKREA